MKEEDDMLELLEEEDIRSDPSLDEELELADDSADDSEDDSLHDSLELDDDTPDEPGISEESDNIEQSEEAGESEEAEKEGFEIDIRYIAVAAVAIIAILAGIVLLVLPMMADNPPQVSFSKEQKGEELFLTHMGGEPIKQDYLTMLINGAPAPAEKYMLMNAAWPWTQGVSLKLDTTGYAKPASVTLVYKPKSLDHVLFDTTVEPTPTPTPTPKPVQTPVTIITPVQQEGNTSAAPAPVQISPPVQVAPPTGSAQAGASSSVIMSVEPSSGAAPLTVQCADKTNGCIRNRVWNFGDGQTSMKRNPGHIFPFPGTYNVSLDVRFCDPDDNPAQLPVKAVTVTPSVRHDTLVQGSGSAQVLAGGKIFFTVKGPGTNIRIGGRDHYLKAGDHVQLTLGESEPGDISVVSHAILRCYFSNVTMNVNGDDLETGTISVININQYLELETADLIIKALAGRDGAKGMMDTQPVISASPGQQIVLKNIGTDSTGKLLFSEQNSAGFNFRGGIGSYEVLTPPPL